MKNWLLPKNIDFISFETIRLENNIIIVSEKKLKEQVNNIVERVATDLKAIVYTRRQKKKVLIEYMKTY